MSLGFFRAGCDHRLELLETSSIKWEDATRVLERKRLSRIIMCSKRKPRSFLLEMDPCDVHFAKQFWRESSKFKQSTPPENLGTYVLSGLGGG